MPPGARLPPLAAWLPCIVLACTIEDARGAPPPQQRPAAQVADAGVLDAGGSARDRNRRKGARGDSLVGLTRAEVKARRGPPTEEHANEWVYTPDQPGCRDRIMSEVVRFKDDAVASVSLRSKQTNKVCGGRERAR